jgi:tRNA pseudouridine38-40 synthase
VSTKFHRYFIQLSYNGTGFCGWQFQPGVPTIQETLQEKMSMLLREKIDVVGCGRTDTGVHAKKYIAHFDCTHSDLAGKEETIFRLNKILPVGIAVQEIFLMQDNAHARFAATSRSYEYHISRVKNVFSQDTAWVTSEKLDIDKMNTGAKILLSYWDFAAFARVGSDNKTTNCTLTQCEWRTEGDELVFYISANRFLRNMVRAIVGTLVDMGRGKISEEELHRIAKSGDRSEASMSVVANGLFLTDVIYPSDIYSHRGAPSTSSGQAPTQNLHGEIKTV